MINTTAKAQERLDLLQGLPLAASNRAVDLRVFQFGTLHPTERGTAGEWALHVQCPWRIEVEDGILTGRHDLFRPAEEPEDFEWDSWDWSGSETLQDRLVADFIGNGMHRVAKVAILAYGDLRLELTGGAALVLLPAGSQGEDWRLFRPHQNEEHLVVSGGRIESV